MTRPPGALSIEDENYQLRNTLQVVRQENIKLEQNHARDVKHIERTTKKYLRANWNCVIYRNRYRQTRQEIYAREKAAGKARQANDLASSSIASSSVDSTTPSPERLEFFARLDEELGISTQVLTKIDKYLDNLTPADFPKEQEVAPSNVEEAGTSDETAAELADLLAVASSSFQQADQTVEEEITTAYMVNFLDDDWLAADLQGLFCPTEEERAAVGIVVPSEEEAAVSVVAPSEMGQSEKVNSPSLVLPQTDPPTTVLPPTNLPSTSSAGFAVS